MSLFMIYKYPHRWLSGTGEKSSSEKATALGLRNRQFRTPSA